MYLFYDENAKSQRKFKTRKKNSNKRIARNVKKHEKKLMKRGRHMKEFFPDLFVLD